MPAMPSTTASNEQVERGILQGAYCFKHAEDIPAVAVNLLASGSIMQQALAAGEQLTKLGYRVNIWSVTSYNELYREAVSIDRWNRLHPEDKPKLSYIEQLFSKEDGVFIAVSDYMTSLSNSIAPWMPDAFTALGTDGYGLSESREALRDYFEVSDKFIVQAALHQLYKHSLIELETLRQQLEPLGIDSNKFYSAER